MSEQLTEQNAADQEALSAALDEKLIEQSKVLEDKGNLQEEPEAPEPKQDDNEPKFSSKFAALSRKEKELRQQQQELSQREQKIAEYERRIAELEQRQNEPVQNDTKELPIEYRLKKNPLKTLEELGLGYDVLTNIALNDGKLNPEMQIELIREEIRNEFKEDLNKLKEDLKQKEETEQKTREQYAIENFKESIKDFVSTNSETYELIKANESYDLIFDVIEDHHKETGRILDMKEAAEYVEAYLEEEFRSLLQKSKKLSPAAQQVAEQRVEKKPSVTLSNSLSAQGAPQAAGKPLSYEDSVARAASIIRWDD